METPAITLHNKNIWEGVLWITLENLVVLALALLVGGWLPLPKNKAALFSGAGLEQMFTAFHFVVARFIFGPYSC